MGLFFMKQKSENKTSAMELYISCKNLSLQKMILRT